MDDYRTLCNSTDHNVRTAWTDKYITAMYRNDWRGTPLRRELQAIPDYLRWIQTNGELHYVSYERLQLLDSSLDAGLMQAQTTQLMSIGIQPPSELDMSTKKKKELVHL